MDGRGKAGEVTVLAGRYFGSDLSEKILFLSDSAWSHLGSLQLAHLPTRACLLSTPQHSQTQFYTERNAK